MTWVRGVERGGAEAATLSLSDETVLSMTYVSAKTREREELTTGAYGRLRSSSEMCQPGLIETSRYTTGERTCHANIVRIAVGRLCRAVHAVEGAAPVSAMDFGMSRLICLEQTAR